MYIVFNGCKPPHSNEPVQFLDCFWIAVNCFLLTISRACNEVSCLQFTKRH